MWIIQELGVVWVILVKRSMWVMRVMRVAGVCECTGYRAHAGCSTCVLNEKGKRRLFRSTADRDTCGMTENMMTRGTFWSAALAKYKGSISCD